MSADGGSNVTPLRPALGKRAEALRGLISFAGGVRPVLDRPYLIKGWLDRGAISVMYGQSNVGKTFLALDIAQRIATRKKWGEARVRRANALYVVCEGGSAFDLRLKAMGDPAFYVLKSLVTVNDPARDAQFLAEAIEGLGLKFGLIIIDTLARAMGAADENTLADMARFLACVERLRDMTGAHVMLIHHAGKDATRGARGHSSLRAAVDTEIELLRQDGQDVIEATATKQRDLPSGLVFSYRLKPVALGVDSDGNPVTSCVVEPVEQAAKAAPTSVRARQALAVLDEALRTTGEAGLAAEAWREACDKGGVFRDLAPDSRRSIFSRIRKDMLKEGFVLCAEDVWSLPKQAKQAETERDHDVFQESGAVRDGGTDGTPP